MAYNNVRADECHQQNKDILNHGLSTNDVQPQSKKSKVIDVDGDAISDVAITGGPALGTIAPSS